MIVYADQMLLENFIMNYIILYLTSYFSGVERKWYRLSISATLGALYTISSYIFNFYDSQMILAKIVLSVFMVLISFKFRNIKNFFKILLFFYGITFVIGGASFGLAYFFELYKISDGGVIYVNEFPIYMVFIGIIASIFIFKVLTLYIKRWINTKELLHKIKIEIVGEEIELIALLDSGHNVTEPVTHYPVIMIENTSLKEIISEDNLKKFNTNSLEKIDEKFKKYIRLIPLSTVTSEKEVMVGIRATKLIFYDSGKYVLNPIVVPCRERLSENGSYQALISKNLI